MIGTESEMEANILLVEDNPGDARLALEALKEGPFSSTLYWVKDGVEAMEFLKRQGQFSDVPRPDIILLDLNMPRMSGRDVLAEMKSDPRFRQIPVIVVTVSSSEEDIMKCYDLHANCFVTKPLDLLAFMDVVKAVEEFWLSVVRLPIL